MDWRAFSKYPKKASCEPHMIDDIASSKFLMNKTRYVYMLI